MMRIYGTANSRSTRVLWTLEELGWEYTYTHINLFSKDADDMRFRALNPAKKVPVLEHDGLLLTESAAICLYLADLDPARRLAPPPDSALRARFHQWCFFALSELEQPLWTLAKHRFVLPEALRADAVGPAATHEFTGMLDVLLQGLANQPYILGEQLCCADLLIANTLAWARGNNFTLPATLDAYADRLLGRPALAQALAREAQAVT